MPVKFGHNVVEKLLQGFSSAVSTFLLITLFVILQYIFDIDFQCSCTEGFHLNAWLYLISPPMILTWVLHVVESFQQRRISGFYKKIIWNNCCSNLCMFLIKFLSLSAVWIAAVLFDGDWYFCIRTNLDSNQTGLPCKDSLTDEQKLIRTSHTIESQEIGLGLVCGLILFLSLVRTVRVCYIRWNGWKKFNWTELCCPPYYRVVYDNLLAEKVSSQLEDELTKIAEDRAKAICQPHIQTIQDHEKNRGTENSNDTVNSKVWETWQKISALNFYMEDETLSGATSDETLSGATSDETLSGATSDETLSGATSDTENAPLRTIDSENTRNRVWTLREEHIQFHNDF